MLHLYPRAYMPNDPINARDGDEWRINIHDPWQVLWWCQYFCVSKSDLEAAIRATGSTAVDEIQGYLRNYHN